MPCGIAEPNLFQAPLLLAIVTANLDDFAIAQACMRLYFDKPCILHSNGDANNYGSCSSFHEIIDWTCKNNGLLVSVPPLGCLPIWKGHPFRGWIPLEEQVLNNFWHKDKDIFWSSNTNDQKSKKETNPCESVSLCGRWRAAPDLGGRQLPYGP